MFSGVAWSFPSAVASQQQSVILHVLHVLEYEGSEPLMLFSQEHRAGERGELLMQVKEKRTADEKS